VGDMFGLGGTFGRWDVGLGAGTGRWDVVDPGAGTDAVNRLGAGTGAATGCEAIGNICAGIEILTDGVGRLFSRDVVSIGLDITVSGIVSYDSDMTGIRGMPRGGFGGPGNVNHFKGLSLSISGLLGTRTGGVDIFM